MSKDPVVAWLTVDDKDGEILINALLQEKERTYQAWLENSDEEQLHASIVLDGYAVYMQDKLAEARREAERGDAENG